MALKLQTEYKGFIAEYHKIIDVQVDKVKNRVFFQVAVYKNKESSELAGNNALYVECVIKPLSLVKNWNKDIFAIGYELLKESNKIQQYEEDSITPIGNPIEKNKYALAEDC